MLHDPSHYQPPPVAEAIRLSDRDQWRHMPFDMKYTRYETSGLEFTIEGSVDDLKIQLK